MVYKESRFNIVIDRDPHKGVLIANSYTNKHDWLPEDDYNIIHEHEQVADGDVTWQMISNGFVVDYNTDEVNRFLVESDKHNHNEMANTLAFVIAPTMSCNYNCTYCFEKNLGSICNSFMSDETIQDTIQFIKRMSKRYPRTKNIQIKWFGGEPLLHIDAIEKIVNGIRKDFANEDDIRIGQTVITNGRYLTLENAKRLNALGIVNVQIPIDGLPETYAKMKGCSVDDFHAVVENMKACQDFMRISIRVNVSDYNKHEIIDLIDYLDNEGVNALLYTEWVQTYTEDSEGKTKVDTDDYNKILHDTVHYINKEKKHIKRPVQYPVKCYGCEGCLENHWCIAADGGIYRCEHIINDKRFISGDVKHGLLKKSLDHIWMEPLIPDKCRQCVLLPRCLIKCITDRDIEHIEPNCEFLIENYKETVRLHRSFGRHQFNC